MSLPDADLPPQVAHQREMADAIRKQHEDDLAAQFAEYMEQRELESPEAEAARWSGIFRRMKWERPEVVHYPDKPGIDRRLHGSERP